MKKLFICLLSLCVMLGVASTNTVKAEENEISIDTMDELVDFLVDQKSTVTNAKLTDDIVFDDQNPLTLVNQIHIGVNKTLDLNGHDIYFGDCLGLDAFKNINVTITNNSATTSYLTPMEDSSNIFSFAMIATRLSQQDVTFNLNINGNIVIDGKNKDNYTGLCVGYSNPLPHEPGYYNSKHIVTLKDVEVKNFEPSNESNVGIALININGTLNVENCKIHDNMIGVGTAHFNQETFVPETNIVNKEQGQITRIFNNYIGVTNGIDIELPDPFFEGEVIDLDFVPGKLTISGSNNEIFSPVYICGNKIGLQLGSNDIENDNELHKLGPAVYWNDYENQYYNEKDVYLINNAVITAINNPYGSFSVYLDENLELEAEREIVDGSSDLLLNPDQNNIIYRSNNGIFFYNPRLNQKLTTSASSINEGDKVTLKMNVGSNVAEVSVIGPWGFNQLAEIKDGVARLTFVPEHEGEYAFRFEKDSKLVTSNFVTITFGEFPQPTPTPKDESCEKVIGPTWHWNNKKGICEDTGVVKTYTR